jgi:hypothetical protein
MRAPAAGGHRVVGCVSGLVPAVRICIFVCAGFGDSMILTVSGRDRRPENVTIMA